MAAAQSMRRAATPAALVRSCPWIERACVPCCTCSHRVDLLAYGAEVLHCTVQYIEHHWDRAALVWEVLEVNSSMQYIVTRGLVPLSFGLSVLPLLAHLSSHCAGLWPSLLDSWPILAELAVDQCRDGEGLFALQTGTAHAFCDRPGYSAQELASSSLLAYSVFHTPFLMTSSIDSTPSSPCLVPSSASPSAVLTSTNHSRTHYPHHHQLVSASTVEASAPSSPVSSSRQPSTLLVQLAPAAEVMSALAARRPSLTPSSPASRRGSWVDIPAITTSASRRGSRVDLVINASNMTADNPTESTLADASTKLQAQSAAAAATKAAIGNLLSSLAQPPRDASGHLLSETSRVAPLSDSQGTKRKFDSDSDLDMFLGTSAADIQLPSDPARRASIINLATVAAAAVLQSQVAQRRLSVARSEHDQKRQRVEQLGLLVEQARMASVGTTNADVARKLENATQNAAIAAVLANTLGLAPHDTSGTSNPSSPLSPARQPSPLSRRTSITPVMAAPATPRTPRKEPQPSNMIKGETPAAEKENEDHVDPPTSPSSPLAQSVQSESNAASEDKCSVIVGASTDSESTTTQSKSEPASGEPVDETTVAAATESEPVVGQDQQEWDSTVASEGFLDEAKEVANHYSRFYRFEKEWAQKALELEHRRASVRIDPLAPPTEAAAVLSSVRGSRATSPTLQRSAPETRINSRGASPAFDASLKTMALPGLSTSSSSTGLATVLSTFADLIEHRQRSCSGLEALAKQAKELPVKRLSQPNPQFRTTFGEFSWHKRPSQSSSLATSSRADALASSLSTGTTQTPSISETSGDVEADYDAVSDATSSLKAPNKEDQAQDSVADPPATPRSTMSIASML
ncbi:hypothetical protein BCV70DRAFT_205145 [Testicularia cyperi]|uniref:Uncharacterized protein n=1 Tax=Testicularia cyperi TaxID=1882483 RepID=A0A317XTZ1_9BASI|nr:hypothetical protein BCV70DRAFT_205145 [Testicularia cyperi]